jgi:hypothetical protein
MSRSAHLAPRPPSRHSRGSIGAGPDERMHGGLAPFNAVNWPLPTRLQLARP